jgi:hypothetical protein
LSAACRVSAAATSHPRDALSTNQLLVFRVSVTGAMAVDTNGEHGACQQKKQRNLPAVAKENIAARFF